MHCAEIRGILRRCNETQLKQSSDCCSFSPCINTRFTYMQQTFQVLLSHPSAAMQMLFVTSKWMK